MDQCLWGLQHHMNKDHMILVVTGRMGEDGLSRENSGIYIKQEHLTGGNITCLAKSQKMKDQELERGRSRKKRSACDRRFVKVVRLLLFHHGDTIPDWKTEIGERLFEPIVAKRFQHITTRERKHGEPAQHTVARDFLVAGLNEQEWEVWKHRMQSADLINQAPFLKASKQFSTQNMML